jgi:hypothetical protein
MVADSSSSHKSSTGSASSASSASTSSQASSRGFSTGDAGSLNDIGKNFGVAYAAGLAYLSAQADRLRVATRNVILLLILAAVAAVIGGTVVIVATALLVLGIAQGIGTLLGGRPWAGDLITGGGVVAAVAITAYVIVSKMAKAARRRTLASYEKTRF